MDLVPWFIQCVDDFFAEMLCDLLSCEVPELYPNMKVNAVVAQPLAVHAV